jgi:hypothetical protein
VVVMPLRGSPAHPGLAPSAPVVPMVPLGGGPVLPAAHSKNADGGMSGMHELPVIPQPGPQHYPQGRESQPWLERR